MQTTENVSLFSFKLSNRLKLYITHPFQPARATHT